MQQKSSKSEIDKHSRDEVAKALEILFATDYIDKKKLYLENFIRGIVFSAGGVIGATVVIGLLIWILSLFDSLPVIGPLFDGTSDSIRQKQP